MGVRACLGPSRVHGWVRHTCSYAARLDIQPDSDLLTNTGREIRLVPGSGSRLGWGWQLKGRTGLRDTGSRLGGEVGTAGAPIQGPWTEGRGMGGCWDREAMQMGICGRCTSCSHGISRDAQNMSSKLTSQNGEENIILFRYSVSQTLYGEWTPHGVTGSFPFLIL